MTITKKPQRNRLAAKQESSDDAAEKFIAGAVFSREEASQEDRKKVPIMVRFDRALLQRVDKAAKHRSISRSAWIQFTLSRAFDQGEG